MTLLEHVTRFYEDAEIRIKDTFKVGDYIVKRITSTKHLGEVEFMTISVMADQSADNAEYLPDIFYEDGFFTNEKPSFKIQTTAYGAKAPQEIQKVIDGYKKAIDAVAEMTKKFC